MEKKEYEWTGKYSVRNGRAYKKGEVLSLTEAEAAPLLADGAVEAKGKSSSRPPEKPAEKPEGVK